MNTNYAIARITNKNKGQFFSMSYISDLPMTSLAKAGGIIALKSTKGTFRYGIEYNKMKSVQAKRINGTLPANPQKLPWGTWDTEHPGLIINHKDKKYIRLYMTPNKSKSTYYLNGKPISKEELMAMGVVQKSYWNKSDITPDCITINVANIQEIW